MYVYCILISFQPIERKSLLIIMCIFQRHSSSMDIMCYVLCIEIHLEWKSQKKSTRNNITSEPTILQNIYSNVDLNRIADRVEKTKCCQHSLAFITCIKYKCVNKMNGIFLIEILMSLNNIWFWCVSQRQHFLLRFVCFCSRFLVSISFLSTIPKCVLFTSRHIKCSPCDFYSLITFSLTLWKCVSSLLTK